MQASRLLAILLHLQSRGQVSAQNLAALFEVSVRTIYRDVDQLSAAGVPVYAEKGRLGGFRLLDGYRTKLTGLDRPEAESLFLAGLPFAAEALGLAVPAASARLKLLAALPEALQKDAQRVASRFHLDPTAWFHSPDAHAVLPRLAAAVWTSTFVRLRYDSWKAVVERRALALGLVMKAGLWYFVAQVDGQPRTYRVASILDLAVEDETGLAPSDFDLKRYWATFAKDYEQRMQSETARVRVRGQGLRRLGQVSEAVRHSLANAGPEDRDGWRHVKIPIESVEDAALLLLRLAPDVEALGPASLLRSIRQAIAGLRKTYSA